MSPMLSDDYATDIVQDRRELPAETERAEFKVDMVNPQEIGEYISALSNSAALTGKNNTT